MCASVELLWAHISWLRGVHLQLLSPPEVERWATLRRAEDRARFAVAAATLRLAIAERTRADPAKVEVERTCDECALPHGKPRLPGTHWSVSISHSGALAVVAITERAAIGVDVEAVRPLDYRRLIADVATPREQVDDMSLADFYALWTRKESVLKATGAGLRIPMTHIEVATPRAPPQLLAYRSGAPPRAWMADLAPRPGYVGAVTALDVGPVHLHERSAAPLLADALLTLHT